jgi:hypothetical protein
MEYSWDGMNIETINSLYIFPKKIVDVTTISSVNQDEVSQYLSDILLDKISGQVLVSESSIHTGISWRISSHLPQKSEQKI